MFRPQIPNKFQILHFPILHLLEKKHQSVTSYPSNMYKVRQSIKNISLVKHDQKKKILFQADRIR